MSASEKLKALDLRPFAMVIDLDRWRVFQRALPQIVAVVEAAEKVAEGPWPEGLALNLRTALSALDEALPGGGLSDQAFDELEQEREKIERTFGG